MNASPSTPPLTPDPAHTGPDHADTGTADLGSEALMLLGRISRLNRLFTAAISPVLERELGLSTKDIMVFGAVARGHTQPGQISAMLGTPPPTTSRLLEHLTEAGYLERSGVPGDLRKCQMNLTEHGQQTRQKALAVLGDTVAQELVRARIPQERLHGTLEELRQLEVALGIKEYA